MADDINKVKRSSSVHSTIYVLLVSLLLASGYFNYSYFSSVKKAEPSVTSCTTIDQLPESVRASYVDIAKYNSVLDARIQLEMQLNSANDALENLEGQRAESEPEMPSEQESSLAANQESKNQMGLTMVKDFAKCYDMGNANRKVTKVCRQNIIDYVDKHKEAKYFEIIGIVDDLEFNLFENLDRRKSLHKKLGVDQRVINKLKKYAQRGLAKERASEASWVIKAHTKRKAATYNANYELISKKGHKGVIIRAYK